MATTQDPVQLLVKIELGHNASCRKQKTPEGFTHDWVVFVRGPENKDISHFVDKVVFLLHESFSKPKRVVKEPPYRLAESGYGGFDLPIDIYFKNKEEPKKVRLTYSLSLPAIGLPAINNIRSEALKFINPPEEFKRKVIKAGGEIIDPNRVSSPITTNNTNGVAANAPTTSNSTGKEIKKETTKEKPVHPEPEKPKKVKTEKTEKPLANQKQSNKPVETNTSTSNHMKRSSTSGEDGQTTKKKKKIKVERDSSPVNKLPIGFIPIELPPAGSNEKDRVLETKDIKLKIKSMPPKTEKVTEKPMTEKVTKKKMKEKGVDSVGNLTETPPSNAKQRKSSSSSGKKNSEKSTKCLSEPRSKLPKVEEKKLEKITFRRGSGESWSSTSSASSGLFNTAVGGSTGKNNALGTLMAELVDANTEDNDSDSDDNEFLKLATPFQPVPKQSTDVKTSRLNNNNSPSVKDNKTSSSSKPSKAKTKSATHQRKQDVRSSVSKVNGVKSPSITNKTDGGRQHASSVSKQSPKTKVKETKTTTNGHQSHKIDLIQLHKRLSTTRDSNCLQKVADILEQSGCYQLTETSLCFDLYSLDMETIRRLEGCLDR